MFTWLSDRTVATSERRRVRSRASTWIATVNVVGLPSAQVDLDHPLRLLLSDSHVRAVGPVHGHARPRVTNPTM